MARPANELRIERVDPPRDEPRRCDDCSRARVALFANEDDTLAFCWWCIARPAGAGTKNGKPPRFVSAAMSVRPPIKVEQARPPKKRPAR